MKVRFTLGIGIANAYQEEVVEYDDDWFDDLSEEEKEELLNEEWNLWAWGYIDGGPSIVEE